MSPFDRKQKTSVTELSRIKFVFSNVVPGKGGQKKKSVSTEECLMVP